MGVSASCIPKLWNQPAVIASLEFQKRSGVVDPGVISLLDDMMESFQIRRATVQDAETVAWHRARMFQDMGEVSPDAFEILRAKARVRLEQWIESGDYVGWLATPTGQPELVVAGAGVQLQPILPRPLNTSTIGEGRQGTVVNVFTEPEWRRRGIASLLMREIIVWSKSEQIDRLLLHASKDGRSVYERLGFIAGKEMRFVGE
jgi:GNAT superfamily N-acetyltransferase